MTAAGAACCGDVRRRHAFWAVLGLVAALRLVPLLSGAICTIDETRYLRLAQAGATTPHVLWRHDYPPGWPTLLTPVVALTPGPAETSGRALAVALALLAAVAVWQFGVARFDARVGVAAAALFAVLPGAVDSGGYALSEAAYLPCLVIAAAWLGRLVEGPAVGPAIGLGLASGCAFLVRPEGLIPAAIGGAWLVGVVVCAPGGMARAASALGALCLSAGACVAPYVLATGRLTAKKAVAWMGVPGAERFRGPDDPLHALLEDWIGTDPAEYGERAPVVEFAKEWVAGFSPLLAVTAGAILVWSLWARRVRPRRCDVALIGLLVLFALAHARLLGTAGYLSARHVWPLAVLTLPWVAAGVLAAMDRLAMRRRLAARVAVVAAALAFLLAGVWPALESLREHRGHLRTAGRRLAAVARPGDRVVTDDPRVAYYAGLSAAILGKTDRASLLSTSARGFRFVAARADRLARRVPDLRWDGSDPRVAKLDLIPDDGRPGDADEAYVLIEFRGG